MRSLLSRFSASTRAGAGASRRAFPASALPLLFATIVVAPLWAGQSVASAATPTTVYSWGYFGSAGQLSPSVDRPTAVPGFPTDVVQIATSNSDTYALTSTGQVWAVGANQYGELGDGSTTNSFTTAVQVQFPAGVTITSLANPEPYDTAIAMDSTGHAWGWGVNDGGELCLGSATKETSPVELMALSGVTLATGAGAHAIYYAGGTLYGCGDNSHGALGTGNTTSSFTPVKTTGLPSSLTVTAVTSSYEGSGALLSDGSYWDWGLNDLGQLGNGTETNATTPFHVSLPASVAEVSQGGSANHDGQTLAVLSNGAIYGWGSDEYGQLCNAMETAAVTLPEVITPPSGVTWTSAYSGGKTTFAIDSNGNLWGCGYNKEGQVGYGKLTLRRLFPKVILSQVSQVSATANNGAALQP